MAVTSAEEENSYAENSLQKLYRRSSKRKNISENKYNIRLQLKAAAHQSV
jgi:hypothetical protein